MPSADKIHAAFAEGLKQLSCPLCQAHYTQGAVLWTDAWLEGRRDALRELGKQERDGPIKLKCETCGGLARSNAFLKPPVAIPKD